MRKLIILTVILSIAVLIGACKDEESNPTDNSGQERGTMEATVDGNSWSSDEATYSSIRVSAYQEKDDETSTIIIDIGSDPEIGSGVAVCTYSEGEAGDETHWKDNEGSYEIKSITDGKIKGTFNFTGANNDGDVKVISGSFNAIVIKYAL